MPVDLPRRSLRGLSLAAVLILGSAAFPAGAQEVTEIARPNEDRTGYRIDYDALATMPGLTQAERYQVARALRISEGHIPSGIEAIAGLSAKCKIDKFVGIPVGVDCTVTADPAATKVLVKLGAFALTNAICLVIDVEDGEITEPICDLLLEAVVSSTIEPVLEQCADRSQSTSIELGFKLIPPKLKADAKCT